MTRFILPGASLIQLEIDEFPKKERRNNDDAILSIWVHQFKNFLSGMQLFFKGQFTPI